MKTTQTAWAIIFIVIAINIMVFFGYKDPQGNLILGIISLVLILLFHSLTITVGNNYIKFSFGIGLIRGKYKLEDIKYCRPVHYFSMGWGIRFRPGIILYNVSGNKAIELSIRNKSRKVWIGTDKPEEISDYINSLFMRIKG